MEALKNILSVAVYVFLSGVLVSAIFGGVRNIYYAWKTRKWKNVAFTLVVFIASIALFVWADMFQILGDTCYFFYKLCQQMAPC